jgi:hypothetical protein
MQAVVEAVVVEGRRRDPEHQAAGVAWVDGDPTQIDSMAKAAKTSGGSVVIILDIMHVLAYLWKAAQALFDPEEPHAAQGVGDKIEPLWHGQVKSLGRS